MFERFKDKKVWGPILGILALAAEKDRVDLPTAVDSLRETTFYASPGLLGQLLDKHGHR